MKIAITCCGKTLDDPLDFRFGRAANILYMDRETLQYTAVSNDAAASASGAGIAAAQAVIDRGVDAVITGQLGPNALNVLREGDVELYQGITASVRLNIEALKEGKLQRITESGPAHHGQGRHGGRP
jgi:predicted Fe-Mo cluster-binding NifX family protein